MPWIQVNRKIYIQIELRQENDKMEIRHISETEFEAESITTVVNYYNKEKRPAKETIYRTTETKHRTEYAAYRMEASCPPTILPNARSLSLCSIPSLLLLSGFCHLCLVDPPSLKGKEVVIGDTIENIK